MPHPSNTAQPCHDSRHPDERIEMALSLCLERGAQLTAIRQKVLELLCAYDRPTGAYELIEALREKGERPVGPPTVYRALEFLTEQGFVTRIESRNAYVPCAHPERQHACQFIICTDCGASSELEDPRVERLLAENATRLGYEVGRPIVEVEGKCANCVQAETRPKAAEARS